MKHFNALRLTVREILRRADAFEWSLQGFGLLRLYLGREGRLHIWAPELSYDGVSTIHDHSWNLTSTIIVGRLQNNRYYVAGDNRDGMPYHRKKLVTGYNTRDVSPVEDVTLRVESEETFYPGDTYSQTAAEIHETIPSPYTVTLMERYEDIDGIATVYWPAGTQWGTARPRVATAAEVEHAADQALRLFP